MLSTNTCSPFMQVVRTLSPNYFPHQQYMYVWSTTNPLAFSCTSTKTLLDWGPKSTVETIRFHDQDLALTLSVYNCTFGLIDFRKIVLALIPIKSHCIPSYFFELHKRRSGRSRRISMILATARGVLQHMGIESFESAIVRTPYAFDVRVSVRPLGKTISHYMPH